MTRMLLHEALDTSATCHRAPMGSGSGVSRRRRGKPLPSFAIGADRSTTMLDARRPGAACAPRGSPSVASHRRLFRGELVPAASCRWWRTNGASLPSGRRRSGRVHLALAADASFARPRPLADGPETSACGPSPSPPAWSSEHRSQREHVPDQVRKSLSVNLLPGHVADVSFTSSTRSSFARRLVDVLESVGPAYPGSADAAPTAASSMRFLDHPPLGAEGKADRRPSSRQAASSVVNRPSRCARVSRCLSDQRALEELPTVARRSAGQRVRRSRRRPGADRRHPAAKARCALLLFSLTAVQTG